MLFRSAKYTTFFLGAGILGWLVFSRDQRRWLATPWPYLGAALALAMFIPVVLWNAEHGWSSFALQFGRVGSGALTVRYFGDFFVGQLVLATPFILVLAGTGFAGSWRTAQTPFVLPASLLIPAIGYFLVHALHAEVQGNWPSFA